MGRPEITGDQRAIAIELLANALRKDAHLRARASGMSDREDPLRRAIARRRSEPSQRYVDGMRDLLKMLFVDGHAAAEEILEEAYRRAIGAPKAPPSGSNGSHFQ